MDSLDYILAAVLVFSLGNYAGDQATIKDCATKGEAYMLGGGAACMVKKETP